MRQAKTDLAEQIFSATDRLMAREGLNQLSMHKLAKEANCGRRNDLPLF